MRWGGFASRAWTCRRSQRSTRCWTSAWDNLERSVDELKTRVNGLVFLVAGAVIVQVVLRLLEWS